MKLYEYEYLLKISNVIEVLRVCIFQRFVTLWIHLHPTAEIQNYHFESNENLGDE